MFKNIIKIFKKIVKKLKSTKGNSLAEFAVTTAMMATLATTAAQKVVVDFLVRLSIVLKLVVSI
jgi:hypothetical protein